jgi:hypothetical protein
MLDDVTMGASAPLPRCMWCSAELPSDSEVTCPSCGATLIGEGDNPVPGVTAIDAEAIVRGAREARTKPRSRLMSWISGEYDDESDKPAPPGSLSPPPPEVRREMLRLELEAQVANLQAEAGAMAAEAAVESGVPFDIAGTENGDEPHATVDSTAPAASIDAPAPASAVAATPTADATASSDRTADAGSTETKPAD